MHWYDDYFKSIGSSGYLGREAITGFFWLTILIILGAFLMYTSYKLQRAATRTYMIVEKNTNKVVFKGNLYALKSYVNVVGPVNHEKFIRELDEELNVRGYKLIVSDKEKLYNFNLESLK